MDGDLQSVEERVLGRALQECEPARTIYVGAGLPERLRSRLNGAHSFTSDTNASVDIAVVELDKITCAGLAKTPALTQAKRLVGVSTRSVNDLAHQFEDCRGQGRPVDLLITGSAVFAFHEHQPVVLEIEQGCSALDLHREIGRPLLAAPTLKAYGAS